MPLTDTLIVQRHLSRQLCWWQDEVILLKTTGILVKKKKIVGNVLVVPINILMKAEKAFLAMLSHGLLKA